MVLTDCIPAIHLSKASAYMDVSSEPSLGNGLDLSGKNALGITASSSKSSILPQPVALLPPPVAAGHRPASVSQSYSYRSVATMAKKQLAADSTAPPLGGDFFHLFVELRAFVANPCIPGETCELYFALYSRAIGQYISEEFLVVINSSGSPANSQHTSADGTLNLGRVRTLFQDLGSQDVGEIVLVCRIVRCGAMKMSAVGSQASPGSSIRSSTTLLEPPSDTSSIANGRSGQQFLQPPSASSGSPQPRSKLATAPFRRPFGCAVLDVSQFVKGAEDAVSRPREVTMQIFVPADEANFATLHEDIINSRTSQFQRSTRSVTLLSF